MENITGYLKKISPYCFFLLFLFYGIAVVSDYGISWDEPAERYSNLIHLGYIIPEAKELVSDTVNFYGMPELWEFRERYYGIAGQFPAILAEYLYDFRFDFRQIYLLRHMYTFSVFFISCIFFYLICKNFTHSRFFSLLGVFLLISSPRILADSFYNVKDLLFLSFFVISLYFGLLLIRKQSVSRLLAFGFFGGLCTNVRIVGAISVACCAAALGWKLLPAGKKDGYPFWKKLVYITGSGAVSILFYMVFTPVMWENPVEGIKGVFRTFSNYTLYDQPVFYMGRNIQPDQLPWHYLPVWIMASTPLFPLFLMAAGLLFQSRVLIKTWKTCKKLMFYPTEARVEKTFLCMNVIIPLLYVFFYRPVLYNGWRHFYFIYPVMILAALYGLICLYALFKRQRYHAKAVGSCLLAVGILPAVIWIARNHPFEYLYFNEIARPYAEKYFEKDYWGVSSYDALQYICQKDGRESVSVYMMTPDASRYLLNHKDQSRIRIVKDLAVADYFIYNHTRSIDTGAIVRAESLYRSDYVKEIDRMAVYTIFERAYTPYFRSSLELRYTQKTEAVDVAAETGNITWDISSSGDSVALTGRLASPVCSERIRLVSGSSKTYEYQPGEMEVYLSSDGENWIKPEILSLGGYDCHCVFPAMELAYIRLICQKKTKTQEDYVWNTEIQILTARSGDTDSRVAAVIRTSTASAQPQYANLAYDKNLDTRWSNAPEPGLYYKAELASVISVSQIKLVQAGFRTDFPPALEILYSLNGTDWNLLNYQSDDMETFTFEPVNMKYVIFRIPEESDFSVPTDWSIYEIQFFIRRHIE